MNGWLRQSGAWLLRRPWTLVLPGRGVGVRELRVEAGQVDGERPGDRDTQRVAVDSGGDVAVDGLVELVGVHDGRLALALDPPEVRHAGLGVERRPVPAVPPRGPGRFDL